MVKNGDLLDVEPDGSITVAGKPIGGGGGGDYTAGSNIQISEAKEISLKKNITGINSFKFAENLSPTIGSFGGDGIKIKCNSTANSYAPIYLFRKGFNESERKYLNFIFYTDDKSNNTLFFDARSFPETNYVFITRGGKVPPVPSADGTYVLKATVSGGAVTYTWVAQ